MACIPRLHVLVRRGAFWTRIADDDVSGASQDRNYAKLMLESINVQLFILRE
jgi:hypothetical protein